MRRSRRTAAGADPPGEQARGQLLDDRAAELAADRLASVGDLEGDGQDRLGPGARGRVGGRRRTASGTSPSSASDRSISPFITARARTRWSWVGVGEGVGGARDERIGLDARRRRPRVRRAPRPGTSRSLAQGEQDDLRERRQPVDRAVRVLDAADLVDGALDGVVDRPGRRVSAPRAAATASSRSRHAVGRSWMYDHSSSISSPSSARRGVGSRARARGRPRRWRRSRVTLEAYAARRRRSALPRGRVPALAGGRCSALGAAIAGAGAPRRRVRARCRSAGGSRSARRRRASSRRRARSSQAREYASVASVRRRAACARSPSDLELGDAIEDGAVQGGQILGGRVGLHGASTMDGRWSRAE